MDRKILLIMILALGLLAACADNTPAPTPTPETIDNQAETSAEVSGAGRANFEVTGDITAVVDGEDVYVEQAAEGANEIHILHINRADGTQLYIQFPRTAEVGSYNITNVNVSTESDIATGPAVTAVLVIPTGGEAIDSYLGVTGNLTLTEVGETFSGDFQFNASDNPSAQPPIEGTSLTADVTGDFEDVPVR